MPADQAPLAKSSDTQLMAAVQAGDAEALGALFSRHHGAVYALCTRLIQDDDLADDITQEVFLRVWRYARSFRGDSAFRTWLYRLVYNACTDRRQRDARWQEFFDFDLLPADTPSAELTDRHMLLETALNRLSPKLRVVLVLSRFDGLGYDEIARIINCSPGAARVRLHRAMNALRQLCFALEAGGRST
jgi:RNA polymerase sigma-70 factor (ECF subfamily)